jgi:cytochrome c oxidase subunit 4
MSEVGHGIGHPGEPARPRPRDRGPSAKALFAVLVALLVLAGISLALRFAHIGSYSFPVALGIAAIKAVLVALFFMELIHEKGTVRFAILTGVSLFTLLMVLVVADVLTRSVPPLKNPPGTAERYDG